MKTQVNIWIILVGILIGAISYWRIPYAEMHLLGINMWLFVGSGTLIGSLLSSLLFNQKPWIVGLLITFGVILSIIIRIVYDVTFWDSTSHNFAPFEVIIGGLQSLPMGFVGAYLSKFIQTVKK